MTISELKALEVGRRAKWENCPLSSGMLSVALGGGFEVRWITTNWDASTGYLLISRHF